MGKMVQAALPTAYTWQGSTNVTPRTRSGMNGTTILVNTEAYANISLPATGSTTTLVPAILPASLPWLSATALSYSRYRFLRYRLWYLPSVGTNVSGRIAMSQSFDFNDTVPTTVSAIIVGSHASFGPVYGGNGSFNFNNPFGNSTLIKTDFDVSRGTGSKPFLPVTTVDKFNALSPSDKLLYSPGQIIIGTDGSASASAITCGSVYVSYEIELMDPVAVASQ